jgi:ligand-binding SRPBCC domain-containing protein
MKYQHRFRVNAPLEKVVDFHSRAGSMVAITPPPIRVTLDRSPETLAEGDEMEFTMQIGPLPIHWVARIEGVSSTGFKDRQLRGPFAEWTHSHTFVFVDDHTTDVIDEINLRLSNRLVWWVIGLAMRIGLPILFSYRAKKTRKLLQ